MVTVSWDKAVHDAISRQIVKRKTTIFDRQDLIKDELKQIESETGTTAKNTDQSLSYELQQLRNNKHIVFLDNEGTYAIINICHFFNCV